MYKHKLFELQNTLQFTTLVNTGSHSEYLSCGMSYDLSSTCPIFCSNSNIMITLNPKPEKSSSISHFLICSRIFLKPFHITHIAPNFTTADNEQYIQEIGCNNDTNGSTNIKELPRYPNCSNYDAPQQNQTYNYNCHMKGGLLFHRNVLLGKCRISHVEKHCSKSICNAFIACHEGVRIQRLHLRHIWVCGHHIHLWIRGQIVGLKLVSSIRIHILPRVWVGLKHLQYCLYYLIKILNLVKSQQR